MTTAGTRCFPIVGHPVAQTHTPAPMNQWFRDNGIDAVMFGADILPDGISGFFDNLRHWANCGGCSVTLPYKRIAHDAVDMLSDRARRIGTVNTILRRRNGELVGEMTDGLAMVHALAQNGVEVSGKSVVVAGAGGGAGMAIADALCEAGIAALIAIEPDAGRLAQLKELLAAHYPDVAFVHSPLAGMQADVAINASPLGMNEGDPLPLDLSLVATDGLVADAVTKPAVTPLLEAARKRGLRVQTGAQLGDAQLPFQLKHWGFAAAAG